MAREILIGMPRTTEMVALVHIMGIKESAFSQATVVVECLFSHMNI